ncbi:MAG: CDP-diacylglycerol--serine O-phosphatidyltransferase [Marinagarivorans sp.]|nr:CDP-diacylglycerol--serine O-phosphatidyltransferase [Marinagarivorans sp.]
MSNQNDNNFKNVEEHPLAQIVDEHIEEVEEKGQKVRRKGVYLLPNLFTTAALFSGFFAIVSGMNGHFEHAAMAIFVAQLLDGFDGRVARMTNTTSAFGVEYDSLSDMVSFGLAPALVMFSWGLEPLGKLGWAAAFIFCACAALRLARFNTQVATVDKRYFVGLASPPAAAILAAIVWSWSDATPSYEVAALLGLMTTAIGLLMVSNVRYTSFKGLDLRGRVPFVVLFVAVLIFVLVTVDPARMLLLMAVTYCLSGPAMWVFGFFKKRGQKSVDVGV